MRLNMKKIFLCFVLVNVFLTVAAQSLVKYTGKVETGYHFFLSRPLKADAGEGWKGYQLNNNPAGIDLNIVNGISFRNNLRLGLGAGYLNYEGTKGYAVFGDLEYLTSGTKTSPLFNLKIGRSHINNQYDGGSTGSFVDVSGGVEHQVFKKVSLQFKAGFRFVHQSIFLPVRVGIRF